MKTKQKIFIISDLHLGHYNVLKHYPKRLELAGITSEEMEDKELATKKHDDWLIGLLNSYIGKKDIVYILGDVCFGSKESARKLINRINGKKYLIFGNHDQSCKGENEKLFVSTGDIKELKFRRSAYDFVDEVNDSFCIEVCHYPLFTWNRRPHGSCMAHGHCHGSIDTVNNESKELRVDVGLDGGFTNYAPKTIEDLYRHYTDIVKEAGCESFQDYIDYKMNKDKYRM